MHVARVAVTLSSRNTADSVIVVIGARSDMIVTTSLASARSSQPLQSK